MNVDRGPFSGEKQTNEEICKVLKIGMRTIDWVKKRFVCCFKDGPNLQDIRKTTGRGWRRIRLRLPVVNRPKGSPVGWSLRLLADKLVELHVAESISYETVRRTLKKTNLSLGK